MENYRKCVVYVPANKVVYLDRAKHNGYNISALFLNLFIAYMDGSIDAHILQKRDLHAKSK